MKKIIAIAIAFVVAFAMPAFAQSTSAWSTPSPLLFTPAPSPAVATPATTPVVAPAPLGCQAQFDAYLAQQGGTPDCLGPDQWGRLVILCRGHQLRVPSAYERFVRSQPEGRECGALQMDTLQDYPRHAPVCEARWGATPVSRHGHVVDCTCTNASTIPVRVGRRVGCALAGNGAQNLVANTLAPSAANDACAEGVTPEQCAELRNQARNVTATNAGDFTRRIEVLEEAVQRHEGRLNDHDARLDALDSRVRVIERRGGGDTGRNEPQDQGAGTARSQSELGPIASPRRAVATISPADPPPAIPVTAVTGIVVTPPSVTARQHDYVLGVGGNVFGLAGAAQVHGLGSIWFQTRHALSDANRAFFVIDALAGVAGAERLGPEVGGMLQASIAYQPARWFAIGVGLAGVGLGKPWGDPRFHGANTLWSATIQVPITFFAGHATFSLNVGGGVGQMTQIVDVRDVNGVFHPDISRRDPPSFFAFNGGIGVGYRL